MPAILYYKQGISLAESNPQHSAVAQCRLARALRLNGEAAAALEVAKAAQDAHCSAFGHFECALASEALGDLPGALSEYEAAQEGGHLMSLITADGPKAVQRRAGLSWSRLASAAQHLQEGNAKQALGLLEALMKQSADNMAQSDVMEAAIVYRACARYLQYELEGAARDFSQAHSSHSSAANFNLQAIQAFLRERDDPGVALSLSGRLLEQLARQVLTELAACVFICKYANPGGPVPHRACHHVPPESAVCPEATTPRLHRVPLGSLPSRALGGPLFHTALPSCAPEALFHTALPSHTVYILN
ncbi:hypothetical protein CYMTET_35469 [Cymbomonas tetramitiformis]|uniref:Uncharacterized protein n=1 Tax=Cymbomonas tetramitiformis TaxID=36881 RepID=A0AAE0KNW8_9CHLO|nr:hypothetical protein CYMTET_35469 [Cymbomonas tetramitiformis]